MSPRPTIDHIIPEISVIIVSWNASRFLEECLNSLTQCSTRTCEVLVVDNASSDGSAAMVADKFPWVQLINGGSNLGFARGNNLAISHARGQYVCLVNSDVIVFPGCLDALADYLDHHPEVGMVGPRILNADHSLQNTCRQFPNLLNKLYVVAGLSRLFPSSSLFSGEEMLWFDHCSERAVDALVGCFIMTRRKAVEQFGLLDERFFMYGEDIDWCYRCRRAGWKVMFFPGTQSLHYGGSSSANAPSRFSIEANRAALQLWAKHRSLAACFLFRCLLILHCTLRASRELFLTMIRRRWSPASQHRFNLQTACLHDLLHTKRKALNDSPCAILK